MRPEHEIFQKLGYHKIANHTILVDLQKSEEELWNALEKKSIRWGVKTALKNQVRIVSPTAKEVDTFYTLYTNRLKAGGVEPEAKESMHLLTSTNVSKLFVVLHGEDVVAGGMVLLDKAHHYAILDLTAASEKGFELQVMPYLYWQLMLFAKQHGMRYFDLGGYDVGARPGDKLYNINKFKERFGGRVVEQPIYATHGRYVSMRKVLGAFKFMRSWYRKE
ncbi:GNAT family N-acetyltransferase [Candidatus Pacearchaeota archaeon]|nr:GNAT family N-acetyltransferase [Candidatus Pacearchaeota archaeon]